MLPVFDNVADFNRAVAENPSLLTKKYHDNLTVLDNAITKGQIDIALAMIEAAKAHNQIAEIGADALHCAARLNNIPVIKSLLAAGVPVDAADSIEKTPLQRAVENGHTEAAELLLGAGANVDYVSTYGYTPLNLAARYDYASLINLLVAYGAEVNLCTDGGTALHHAVLGINPNCVKALLQAGADTNISYTSSIDPSFGTSFGSSLGRTMSSPAQSALGSAIFETVFGYTEYTASSLQVLASFMAHPTCSSMYNTASLNAGTSGGASVEHHPQT